MSGEERSTNHQASPTERSEPPRDKPHPSSHPWRENADRSKPPAPGRSSTDDSAAQDLRDRFLEATAAARSKSSGDIPDGLWLEVWRLLAGDPWCREQLRICASAVLRRTGLPRDWRDDVEQDALLLLARDLRRRPDLGIDPERAARRFSPWLRQVFTNQCREALRRIRRDVARQNGEPIAAEVDQYNPPIDFRIDLQMLIDQLDAFDRTVVKLYVQGFAVREIAQQLGMPFAKTRYALRRGLTHLKSELRRRES